MNDIKHIVLASNNSGKIKEFKHIFSKIGIEIIPQVELNIPEVEEPFFTFIENALHKARNCAKHSGLMALADDSGICVNSLSGKPGVYSARFAGEPKSDQRNNEKLIKELAKFSDKSAYYYCVLVLIRCEKDPQPLISDGTIYGEIVDSPRGINGFGYDPHFLLPEFNKTVAELDPEIKNKISHRKLAVNKLITIFKENYNAT